MRMRYTPVLLGACLLGPGCSFVKNIERNVYWEPKVALDERVILKRHIRLAKLAWEEMVAQYGCQFSDDYRAGFIDGFVDYLTYGGTSADGAGEVPIVPAVPPPNYRRAKSMSPEGLKAAEDWFCGFRHGSATALASGLRQLVTVPVFDRPIPALEDMPGRYQSLPGRSPDSANSPMVQPVTPATPPVEGEPLPPPRPVPPADPIVKPPVAPPAVPGAPPVVPPAAPPAGPPPPPVAGLTPPPPPPPATNPPK
jgi:hypothetical protein